MTGAITGLDFGFNFDTIVNKNDTGQGSLRQFMANANLLSNTGLAQVGQTSGVEASIFMITDGSAHSGLRSGLTNQLTSGVAVITPASALPILSAASTNIDGTTQTTNVGNTNSGTLGTGGSVGVDAISLGTVNRPEVQITATGLASGIVLSGSSVTIDGIAIYGITNTAGAAIQCNTGASDLTVQNSVLGTSATSFTDPGSSTRTKGMGIIIGTGTATVSNNLIGFNGEFGIRLGTTASSSTYTISGNEVRGNGITLVHAGIVMTGSTVASPVFINNNLIIDNAGPGLTIGTVNTGVSLVNNTISSNGTSSTTSSSGINEQGSTATIDRNIISGNFAAGILMYYLATQSLITKNSIYGNGSSMGEIGIDLQNSTDATTFGTAPYFTLNDSGDSDTGANNLANYPILSTAAISGSNLTITGYARPGAIIELFISDNNSSGFGSGQTYLATLTEGSGSSPVDGDATSGAYSGTINGITQGTDTTNRFSFTIPTPGGVTNGTKLTATATISNNTSEFSGNVTVAASYTISGHIQNASAIAISGVTVTLSGGQAGSTTTDGSGNYSFASLPAASNYTVTPTKTNYTFTSTSLSYNALAANQTAADFTGASTVTYTISGHIQNASAIAISGVTVTLSGGQAGSTTTDASGNYSFASLPSTNNYVVTSSLTNYTFSSTSLTYNALSANQTTAAFTGTSTLTYTISGHIQNASAIAISGVTVTLSGGQAASTTTDASGNYSLAGLPSTNNYTVTPTKTNYTFTATSLTCNAQAANQTTADFTGTSTVTYTISGHTQNASAIAISGVTVTLSGGQAGSTTTDANGNYSFPDLPSTNNYTLTPSKSNYTFAPTSLTYNNLGANHMTADFTGALAGVTISGHIHDTSAIAISGVTVTLSGGQSGSTTTDTSGNYSFLSLAAGVNYTVTPSKTDYAFNPASRTFNNLSTNQSADLSGALTPAIALTATVSPTGTVTPGSDLLYTINFTNSGAGFASALIIMNPIPANTDFKLGSVISNLGTSGLTPTLSYSSDGGLNWTYAPSSAAGGAPAGYDRNVTQVRWSFASTLSPTSPNNTGSVSYVTRIR